MPSWKKRESILTNYRSLRNSLLFHYSDIFLKDESREDWAEDKAALEIALADAQKQNEKAKREIASRVEEVDALNEMLSESVKETDEWKTRFGDLQTEHDLAQANWAEREEELLAMQAEAASSGTSLHKSTDSEAWEKQYNELAVQMKELAEARKEIEEVLARTQEQHLSVVEDWKVKLLELHNEYDQYIDDVTQERKKLSSEDAELREQLSEKDQEIDRLTSLVDDKDSNRSVLAEAEDSSQLRASLEEAKEECARLTALLQEQTEKLSIENTNTGLATQLQATEAERAKLVDELTEHAKEYEKLNNLLAEKDKECERLTKLAASAQVLQREHSQSLLCAVELRVCLVQSFSDSHLPFPN
jgi:chromosome segregation ATPase